MCIRDSTAAVPDGLARFDAQRFGEIALALGETRDAVREDVTALVRSKRTHGLDGAQRVRDGLVDGRIAGQRHARHHFACELVTHTEICLLYTSPSPRDRQKSRMLSSA